MTSSFRFSILFAGFALAACGSADEATAKPPVTTPVAEAAEDTGPKTIAEATAGPSKVALWKTGDADTTVYMFGTVHILNPEIQWKNPAFDAAWAESDTIYFEADVTSPEAANEAATLIPQFGMNPAGTTLSSFYTEAEVATINEGLAGLNIRLDMLDPLRPWLAGVQVTNIALQSIGGRPDAGIEMILGAEATELGKPVRYLETLRGQIEILANGDDADQARLFLEGIDDLRNPEAFFARLVGAWYRGDAAGLDAIMVDAMSDAPAVADALLYDRNEKWAVALDTLIDSEEGTFFVAVGAAHLVGEKSVQDFLKTHGHDTERVN